MKPSLPPKIEAKLSNELQDELISLFNPIVQFALDQSPTKNTQSYVGGHPFMLEKHDWPIGEASSQPMIFLLQINFAEVPEVLEYFPRAGMLQWFIDGADDTYGLRWEANSTGEEGLFVRWVSPEELARPAVASPSNVLPYGDLRSGPLKSLSPRRLVFAQRTALPDWADMADGLASSTMSPELHKALAEIFNSKELYEELRGSIMPDFTLGGSPVLIQSDPRIAHGKPHDVIVQIGSGFESLMWGDMGVAQLFGDVRALEQGNISSCWWEWACS